MAVEFEAMLRLGTERLECWVTAVLDGPKLCPVSVVCQYGLERIGEVQADPEAVRQLDAAGRRATPGRCARCGDESESGAVCDGCQWDIHTLDDGLEMSAGGAL